MSQKNLRKPDWRKSYQEMYQEHVDHLRQETGWRRVELPNGKRKYVVDLTEVERRAFAWREAERDLQRAINEWNEGSK